ncbi:MAG: hypothetical protein AABY22_29095 [Nanoarchaeota archaeon]
MSEYKNYKNKNEMSSGEDWAKRLKIEIANYWKGWNTEREYTELLIDRDEFFLRSSNSVIIPKSKPTRQEVAELKRFLKEN